MLGKRDNHYTMKTIWLYVPNGVLNVVQLDGSPKLNVTRVMKIPWRKEPCVLAA